LILLLVRKQATGTANHTGWEHTHHLMACIYLYNPTLFLFGLNLMSSIQRYGWMVDSLNQFSHHALQYILSPLAGRKVMIVIIIYFESTKMKVWAVLVLLFSTFAVSAARSKCNPF